ncbi:MAG: hypothetical protein K2H53_05605 [Clostridia bacterium]|nr:hypothetical protein [Clostridia bacterium]
MLLYTILVGSAIELASVSLPYAVVAIYFIIPAEKLLRKFFGFDNAGTLSAAGSFAGGALFSAMINKMNRPKPPHEKDGDDKPKSRKPSNTKFDTMGALGIGDEVVSGGGRNWRWPEFGFGGNRIWRSELAAGFRGRNRWRSEQVAHGASSAKVGVSTLNALGGGTKWDLAKSKGIRNRLKSVGTYAGYSALNAGKRALRSAPKTAGRTFRRLGIGGVTGGTAALLALGAGAATGDPAKALGLMTAAGAAGYNFGNYYGDKFAKGVGAFAENGRAAFWGDDLKKINQYNFDKEFMSSPETMSKLTQALGSTSKAQEAIRNGSVQALLNEDITDPGKVAKALALKNKFVGRGFSEGEALEKAVAMAKWNKAVNPGVFNPMSRERTVFEQNLSKRGVRKADIDQILEDLEYFEI